MNMGTLVQTTAFTSSLYLRRWDNQQVSSRVIAPPSFRQPLQLLIVLFAIPILCTPSLAHEETHRNLPPLVDDHSSRPSFRLQHGEHLGSSPSRHTSNSASSTTDTSIAAHHDPHDNRFSPTSDAPAAGGNHDSTAPDRFVYKGTYRGTNFGNDESAVFVRVNGVPALDVVLHNDTTISFVVPSVYISDAAVRDSSYLEITIRDKHTVKKLPLATLAGTFERVRLEDFRETALTATNAAKQTGADADPNMQLVSSISSSQEDRPVRLSDADTEAKLPERPPVPYGNEVRANSYTSNDVNKDGGLSENPGVVSKTSHDHHSESPPGNVATHETEDVVDLVDRAEKILLQDPPSDTLQARNLLQQAIHLGDARAMTILGSLLLAGDTPGFSQDIATSVHLISNASRVGYPDAQAVHALLLASGYASPYIKKNIGAAILLWTFAAEAGSHPAKMALAFRYYYGLDVAENCELAATYYREVAREVAVDVNEKIGLSSVDQADDNMVKIRPPMPKSLPMSDRKRLHEKMPPRTLGENNEVIQYYKHAADRGDAAAQVMIGNLYFYGAANMPQDLKLARSLFERAAKKGRADAHSHLGFMDLYERKNLSAVKHLQLASSAGDKLGLHGMGYVTLNGIGVDRNEALAALFFLKAVEAEHPEAMYNLAVMHTTGVGVERSPEDAFRYLQQAAQFGHLQSNYQVGVKLMDGVYPAKRDCNLAVGKFLKDVAQQGSWNRVITKALRSYESGNYGSALYRYLQAAHAGIEIAQYNAAFMFEHNRVYNSDQALDSDDISLQRWSMSSLGVMEEHRDTQDNVPERNELHGGSRKWSRKDCVEEAIDLYQMSAMQGQSSSMVRLGDLVYDEGMDFSRATNAYERASKMRNAEAMFSLGWMHARGFGVKPDANLAKRYFDLAKATDPDAFIPSSIAVYLLRYHSEILDLLDQWHRLSIFSSALDFTDHLKSTAPHVYWIQFLQSDLWHRFGDIVVLTMLVGALAVVVFARQRRLLRGPEHNPEDNIGHLDEVGDAAINNNGPGAFDR